MLKSLKYSVLLLVATTTEAHAANLAVITSPPAMLNLVILIGAAFCMIGAAKILSLVRGGQMTRSWQMFAGAFGVLTLCQIALLGHLLELLVLPTFVVPALLMGMVTLFAFGIFEMKRVLG